jgi:site-specific recombinase XerD
MEREVSAFLAGLEEGRAYSKSTRLAYASDLRVFLAYLRQQLGRIPPAGDLNSELVAAFLEAEYLEGRQRSTLLRRLATLKRFADYLASGGKVPEEVLSLDMALIDHSLANAPASIPERCLSTETVHYLLSIMEDSPRPRSLRDQAILMLLLEIGLSVGNLTMLDLTDLDLRANRLLIQFMGAQEEWCSLGGAGPYLERYVNEGRLDLAQNPGDPALFISQMNGRLSRQGIWQILSHWGRKGVPPITLSPRLLRHTAAWRMAQAGRSLAEIQMLLGHRNPLSTRALMRRLAGAAGNGCSDADKTR